MKKNNFKIRVSTYEVKHLETMSSYIIEFFKIIEYLAITLGIGALYHKTQDNLVGGIYFLCSIAFAAYFTLGWSVFKFKSKNHPKITKLLNSLYLITGILVAGSINFYLFHKLNELIKF